MLYIYSTLLSQEGYNNRFILPTMITHNGRFILNFCWKLQYLYFCPQSRGTSINQKQNCQHMLHFFRHNVKTVGLLNFLLLTMLGLKIKCNHGNRMMTIGRCVLTRNWQGRIHVFFLFISRQHQMDRSTYVNMEVHSAKWGKERMTHVEQELPYTGGQRPFDNTNLLPVRTVIFI